MIPNFFPYRFLYAICDTVTIKNLLLSKCHLIVSFFFLDSYTILTSTTSIGFGVSIAYCAKKERNWNFTDGFLDIWIIEILWKVTADSKNGTRSLNPLENLALYVTHSLRQNTLFLLQEMFFSSIFRIYSPQIFQWIATNKHLLCTCSCNKFSAFCTGDNLHTYKNKYILER